MWQRCHRQLRGLCHPCALIIGIGLPIEFWRRTADPLPGGLDGADSLPPTGSPENP